MAEESIGSHKVVLIGDSGVGKTAIINNLAGNEFHESHITTIGVDFSCKDINVDGTIVRLEVWDTAGQVRFRAISSSYYRAARAIIVVYAVDDAATFNNIRMWLECIEHNTNVPPIVYLVGNNRNLADKRVVEESEGQKVADKYGIRFMEISTKESHSIEELFYSVAKDIKEAPLAEDSEDETVNIRNANKNTKSGSCL